MGRAGSFWIGGLTMVLGALCACGTIVGLDGLEYRPGQVGAACFVPEDCVSGRCTDGTCRAPLTDGGSETEAGSDGCAADTAWSPSSMSVALQGEAASLTINIHETGSGPDINFYICKDGGFINPDIHVRIQASTPNHYGFALFDGDVATNDALCTSNGTLEGTSDFVEGELLGGHVTVVSPAHCYQFWGAGCATTTPSCGFCWTGDTMTMTRTCL